MLIIVKMPTIVVGILTFISMINTTLNSLKAIEVFIFRHFSFYEQLNFVLSRVEHGKRFITSGPARLNYHNGINFWSNVLFSNAKQL